MTKLKHLLFNPARIGRLKSFKNAFNIAGDVFETANVVAQRRQKRTINISTKSI